MILKDIANMEDFLENDCYCPGEIYDSTGFFFQVFEPTDACTLLVKGAYKEDDVTAVVCKDQIICFWIENNNKIVQAVRFDATENNTSEIVKALTGKKDKIIIDEFENGKTEADLNKIMSIADSIIVD